MSSFPDFSDERIGFPEKHPNCGTRDNGWFLPANMQVLETLLDHRTKVVIELGSYIGKSTRFICKHAPNAHIYAVDLWSNSFLENELGHNYNRSANHKIPYDLYDTFLANLWVERSRLMPLKMSTLEGLETLAKFGVKPDMIYIDANHDYGPVKADIDACMRLFPRARLVGDDWDYAGVREAVAKSVREKARADISKHKNDLDVKNGEESKKQDPVATQDGADDEKVDDVAGQTLQVEPVHVQDFKCWTIGDLPAAPGDEVTPGPDNIFYHKKKAVVKKAQAKTNFSSLLSSYSKAKKRKLK